MRISFARTAGLAVLMLGSVAPAFPQGLADTAKKEQARRKKATTTGATKVYTESDLPASPAGAAPSTASDQKTADKSAGVKGPASGATSDQAQQLEIAEYRAMEAELKEGVAIAEAQAQQLAAHPTGGGKICRIPEGVFQPGVTAPEQVVCPYQMESRYDRAKRELDAARAELSKFQEMGRRKGMR